MEFTTEDVRKVASLAKLEFADAELASFSAQLSRIVSFVEKLSEVDTSEVEEMAHPLDVHTVLRPDRPTAGLTREQALRNAPNQDNEFFLVPPVLGK
jgi:aspartyl-tRNA(Asn)/glutamyl-tRNA(Gln) amidotransferase subunit C